MELQPKVKKPHGQTEMGISLTSLHCHLQFPSNASWGHKMGQKAAENEFGEANREESTWRKGSLSWENENKNKNMKVLREVTENIHKFKILNKHFKSVV